MIIEKDVVFLEHFGIKGMRWGVRKDRLGASEFKDKDFVHKEEVFRIINKAGSRPLKDISYVSTNTTDNKRYIHIMNHTLSALLFKDGKTDTQLVLGLREPLKAPSIQRAESEIVNLHKTNKVVQKFVKDNELYFGKNPDSKTLNHLINTALVDDDVLFTGSKVMRAEVKKHFQKIGYNSLLDQNDIREGLAKSPLIVFDPEKTLRLVSTSAIDKVILDNATKTYKETKKAGYT